MTTTQKMTAQWPRYRCTYSAFIGDSRPEGDTAKLVQNLAVVEGHVAAEEANDVDRLLTTISKEPRFALTNMSGPRPSFEIINTFAGVTEYYHHSRTVYEIVRSMHLKQITTDWYVFYESMPTTRPVQIVNGKRQVGPETTGHSIAFFPAKPDGIVGEMPWGPYNRGPRGSPPPPIRQPTSHLPLAEQRNTIEHDRFLHTLQKGDVEGALTPVADNYVLVTRNYYLPGEPTLAVAGRPEARRHYDALHQADEVLGITILNRVVKDWYIFAELAWRLKSRSTGKERQVRTAAMYLVDEEGRILGEMGYGTD